MGVLQNRLFTLTFTYPFLLRLLSSFPTHIFHINPLSSNSFSLYTYHLSIVSLSLRTTSGNMATLSAEAKVNILLSILRTVDASPNMQEVTDELGNDAELGIDTRKTA